MDEVLAQFIKWQKSPSQFIEDNWGLSKQVRGEPFIKGEMLTWQQAEIVDAVELAINGGKKQISVASGH